MSVFDDNEIINDADKEYQKDLYKKIVHNCNFKNKYDIHKHKCEKITGVDRYGQKLEIGDYVLYTYSNSSGTVCGLMLGKISKIDKSSCTVVMEDVELYDKCWSTQTTVKNRNLFKINDLSHIYESSKIFEGLNE